MISLIKIAEILFLWPFRVYRKIRERIRVVPGSFLARSWLVLSDQSLWGCRQGWDWGRGGWGGMGMWPFLLHHRIASHCIFLVGIPSPCGLKHTHDWKHYVPIVLCTRLVINTSMSKSLGSSRQSGNTVTRLMQYTSLSSANLPTWVLCLISSSFHSVSETNICSLNIQPISGLSKAVNHVTI